MSMTGSAAPIIPPQRIMPQPCPAGPPDVVLLWPDVCTLDLLAALHQAGHGPLRSPPQIVSVGHDGARVITHFHLQHRRRGMHEEHVGLIQPAACKRWPCAAASGYQ